jgi:ABC-2 type transport system permease protein
MMRFIRISSHVAKVMLAKKFAHRAELFVLVLASLVPLFMMVIWMGIARETSFGDFSVAKFTAYFCLVFLIGEIVSSTAAEEVEGDIQSGNIGNLLLKPFSILVQYGLSELAGAVVRAIPIFVLIAGVFLLTDAGGEVDGKFLAWAPMAVILAFIINFLLYYIAGLIAFWTDQASTLDLVLTYMLTLFGGVLAPLSLYPDWMRNVLEWSPFAYIINFPIRVVMGDLSTEALMFGLGLQITMVAILAAVAKLIWTLGIKRHGAFG